MAIAAVSHLELLELAAQGLGRGLGFCPGTRGALETLFGGAKASRHLGLTHLPMHPLLPSRLLLGLELGEQPASGAELRINSASGDVALDQAGIHLREAALGGRQPFGDPAELYLRVLPFARQIGRQPHGVVPDGSRVTLLLAGALGGGPRFGQQLLQLDQPRRCRL